MVAEVLATTAVWPLIVEVALRIRGSLVVNETVTTSPILARVVLALEDAMVIGVMVGEVLSKITFEPEVMAEASEL